MAQTIQMRRGTAAAWTAADPVLCSGEIGFETDTGKLKIGDGVTAWASLDYIITAILDDFGDLVGTANQVTVTGGTRAVGSSGVVLSLPQDIHNEAVPTFEGLILLHDDATAILKLKRGNTAISSSDVIGRIDVETSDVTDPGICATIGALSYGTSGETGWRLQVGTPSALIEAMQIDPYGYVGIGTPWPDSPDTILHIQHATEPYFRLTRLDTTVAVGEIVGKIEFETRDSGSPGVAAYIEGVAEGVAGEVGLSFATGAGGAAIERIRISNAGLTTLIGDLAMGANDITMTGSLATTGDRVTKGWFTDLEVSNMPTVGGVSLTGTFVNITGGDAMTGTLDLDDDNISVTWGADQDAGISYDGTNLLINPKLVGTGCVNIKGQTLVDDKIMFTQTDGNEYIDSLADGYLDLVATTAIRLSSPITRVGGDLYIGQDAAVDPAIVMTGDTNDGYIVWYEDEKKFSFDAILNLPLAVYANNAAAIAGGLVAGDLYRTGGDPDVVCIVH